MTFEELHKQLKQVIIDYDKLKKGLISANSNVEFEDILKENIFAISKKTFLKSKEQIIYWSFCSFSVYDKLYEPRLKEFLDNNDNDLFDESIFIEEEVKNIDFLKNTWYLELFETNTKSQIEKSFIKKKKFLEDRLQDLNQTSSVSDLENDDFNSTKISEKIIFLDELGVLDFLRNQKPFNSTKNALAKALSGIMGEKVRSIQSAINPIQNKGVSQKNNPLKATSNVQKVRQKLIEIGFEPRKPN